MKRIILLTTLILNSGTAFCWEVTSKVTRIEPTFSDHLNIMIETSKNPCATGPWLFFRGAGATEQSKENSVKAVYSGLLASMYSNKNVILYGVEGSCDIDQVHLLPN